MHTIVFAGVAEAEHVTKILSSGLPWVFCHAGVAFIGQGLPVDLELDPVLNYGSVFQVIQVQPGVCVSIDV